MIFIFVSYVCFTLKKRDPALITLKRLNPFSYKFNPARDNKSLFVLICSCSGPA